ncbi:MAG: hypothetical protein QUS14_16170, partial [Pyrinomonadaceae bacterium]|nr:hypothetical protein [Pyrinomonadaceae bacterium]
TVRNSSAASDVYKRQLRHRERSGSNAFGSGLSHREGYLRHPEVKLPNVLTFETYLIFRHRVLQLCRHRERAGVRS